MDYLIFLKFSCAVKERERLYPDLKTSDIENFAARKLFEFFNYLINKKSSRKKFLEPINITYETVKKFRKYSRWARTLSHALFWISIISIFLPYHFSMTVILGFMTGVLYFYGIFQEVFSQIVNHAFKNISLAKLECSYMLPELERSKLFEVVRKEWL